MARLVKDNYDPGKYMLLHKQFLDEDEIKQIKELTEEEFRMMEIPRSRYIGMHGIDKVIDTFYKLRDEAGARNYRLEKKLSFNDFPAAVQSKITGSLIVPFVAFVLCMFFMAAGFYTWRIFLYLFLPAFLFYFFVAFDIYQNVTNYGYYKFEGFVISTNDVRFLRQSVNRLITISDGSSSLSFEVPAINKYDIPLNLPVTVYFKKSDLPAESGSNGYMLKNILAVEFAAKNLVVS